MGGRQRWIGLHGGEQTLGGLRKPAKAATGLAAGVQKPGVARPQGQTAIEVGERVGRASLFDRDGTELKQLVGLCLDVGHGGVGHVKAPRGVSWNVWAVSESMLMAMSSRSAGTRRSGTSGVGRFSFHGKHSMGMRKKAMDR